MAPPRKTTEPGKPPTLRVWLLLAAGLAPALLLLILGVYWIKDHAPLWWYWKAGLLFLICLDVAYGMAIATLFVFPAILAVWLAGDRRRGRGGRLILRLGLACVSILGCVVLGEVAAAIVLSSRFGQPPIDPAPSASESVRTPSPTDSIQLPRSFADDSDGDRPTRIVVVGESSAEGVPYNQWMSIGKTVAWGLGRAIPGRRFQERVIAVSGETLERQHRKLANLTNRPDVLILYCGHNEFSARIPNSRDRSHYLDDDAPSAPGLLLEQFAGWSFLHRLIQQNIEKCRIAIPPPANGRRALIDAPAYSPVERERLLKDFRRRVEAIVEYAEAIKAIPILIAPPANDSGFEPSRSFLRAGASRSERKAFERDHLAARALETTDADAAIRSYRDLLARGPEFAAAHFRLARLLEARGEFAEAYRHDILARDADGYPMRCLTSFQDVYREVAARHDCIFIDGQNYFHAISPNGLLDDRLFHDGMHPSFWGQVALAQAALRGLWQRRAFGWPADAPEPTLDPREVARAFGVDAGAWSYVCWWGVMFYDLTGPATYDPSRRLRKRQAFVDAALRIDAGESAENVGQPNIARFDPIPLAPLSRLSDRDDDRAAEPIMGASAGEKDGENAENGE